jgi:hypothetical protein
LRGRNFPGAHENNINAVVFKILRAYLENAPIYLSNPIKINRDSSSRSQIRPKLRVVLHQVMQAKKLKFKSRHFTSAALIIRPSRPGGAVFGLHRHMFSALKAAASRALKTTKRNVNRIVAMSQK